MLEKHHGVRILDEAVESVGEALAPLHPRPPAPGQVGQPAGHRLRPGGDQPERDPRRPSRTAAARSTTSSSSSASSTARAPPARQHAERMAETTAGARRGRGTPRAPGDSAGRTRRTLVEEIRALPRPDRGAATPRRRRPATATRRRRPASSPPASELRRPKTAELRAVQGEIAAVAGLGRLADHRRGRSPAGRASPSARCSPTRSRPCSTSGRSWRSASSASRTRWRRSPSGSGPPAPTSTDPRRPIGVFMLVGPSGVGKTETALALADTLYGGERNLITINMSEYQEAHTVSGLKGSPPGYVGYGEGGVLTEAVRRRPYSVVLLDEVEKAHPDVLELFFQVFDKGTLEDGEGREIDFKNTVILLTSNVGTDTIMQALQGPRDDARRPRPWPRRSAPTCSTRGRSQAGLPRPADRRAVLPHLRRRSCGRSSGSSSAGSASGCGRTTTPSSATATSWSRHRRPLPRGRERRRNVDHILTRTCCPRSPQEVLARMAAAEPISNGPRHGRRGRGIPVRGPLRPLRPESENGGPAGYEHLLRPICNSDELPPSTAGRARVRSARPGSLGAVGWPTTWGRFLVPRGERSRTRPSQTWPLGFVRRPPSHPEMRIRGPPRRPRRRGRGPTTPPEPGIAAKLAPSPGSGRKLARWGLVGLEDELDVEIELGVEEEAGHLDERAE